MELFMNLKFSDLLIKKLLRTVKIIKNEIKRKKMSYPNS